ncbi:hypothetical protein [Encephalitozoon cuniculi GB-M1]|uniref:UPF0328 protein ECU02_0090 n=2 Tax=Encephalitozoon cuniculi TaxID=6035 RepID=Y209_ENCCU|nr:uncharacterized protein ECU02_0090 [Encephalitozoon cuniculi GB-M1]Q8SWH3.1 RecName: Full=UPF0328 protein ECU02_0090 [Encephalitozoon cuniculi GB-M1]AGE95579.1 hypothetical protein ECU02_0090 [Encephalitozoon cuniculi]KMV66528.1 hypothetical protein M970_020020 [Encephalitozoon cuniculi EcunIII-L]UYI28195.1 DUF2463 domain-containing protein [Encephalitozoon cuniculi]CAD25040.1 hypothetical protein [Encephalitozoon cuniculi GB-M1]
MAVTQGIDAHTINQQHRIVIRNFSSFVSLIFTFFACYTFSEHDFKEDLFFRFIVLLPSFSYLILQYLIFFHTTWKGYCKTESTLRNILHSTLIVLLLAFVIINIFSSITFVTDKWNSEDLFFYSIILPSFFIPPTYLLSTSCDFITTSFTATGINILVDLMILLSYLTFLLLLLFLEKAEYRPYFILASFVLILVKSLKEIYLPSRESSSPAASWRVIIFALVFTLAVITHSLSAYVSISTLARYFRLSATGEVLSIS